MKRLLVAMLATTFIMTGCEGVVDGIIDNFIDIRELNPLGNKIDISFDPLDLKEVTEYAQADILADEFSREANLVDGGITTLGISASVLSAEYAGVNDSFSAIGDGMLLEPGQVVLPYKTNFTVTSLFGWRMLDTLYPKFHTGVDFSTGTNTPLYGVAEGGEVVYRQTRTDGFGDYVILRFPVCTRGNTGDPDASLFVLYAHCNKVEATAGGPVTSYGKDSIIGYEGNTGSGSSIHLHMNMYLDTDGPKQNIDTTKIFFSGYPENYTDATTKTYNHPTFLVDPLSAIFDAPSTKHLELRMKEGRGLDVTIAKGDMAAIRRTKFEAFDTAWAADPTQGYPTKYYELNEEHGITPESMDSAWDNYILSLSAIEDKADDLNTIILGSGISSKVMNANEIGRGDMVAVSDPTSFDSFASAEDELKETFPEIYKSDVSDDTIEQFVKDFNSSYSKESGKRQDMLIVLGISGDLLDFRYNVSLAGIRLDTNAYASIGEEIYSLGYKNPFMAVDVMSSSLATYDSYLNYNMMHAAVKHNLLQDYVFKTVMHSIHVGEFSTDVSDDVAVQDFAKAIAQTLVNIEALDNYYPYTDLDDYKSLINIDYFKNTYGISNKSTPIAAGTLGKSVYAALGYN